MQYAIYSLYRFNDFRIWLALQISKRWKSMIFNTFVLTVSILVLILEVGGIPYDNYMAGNAPINNLLGLSIVALALPLYEQLRQIAKQWKIYSFSRHIGFDILNVYRGYFCYYFRRKS